MLGEIVFQSRKVGTHPLLGSADSLADSCEDVVEGTNARLLCIDDSARVISNPGLHISVVSAVLCYFGQSVKHYNLVATLWMIYVATLVANKSLGQAGSRQADEEELLVWVNSTHVSGD